MNAVLIAHAEFASKEIMIIERLTPEFNSYSTKCKRYGNSSSYFAFSFNDDSQTKQINETRLSEDILFIDLVNVHFASERKGETNVGKIEQHVEAPLIYLRRCG